MPTKAAKKPIHSFSTNFLGVVGYISTSVVWLLVCTCALLLSPVGSDVVTLTQSPQVSVVMTLQGTTTTVPNPPSSPLFSFMLGVLGVIVFWAFSYVASRILSRVVRRVVGIFHKKVTLESLFTVKYYIHVVGLTILSFLLLILPGYDWSKIAILMMAFLFGIGGFAALWLQRLFSKRHHVSISHIL